LASSASSRDEYGPAGLLVLPIPRVVEHQQPVPGGGQRRFLVGPGLQVVGEPVDQHDGLGPVPGEPVVHVDPVHGGKWHGLLLWFLWCPGSQHHPRVQFAQHRLGQREVLRGQRGRLVWITH